jgi:hypothetical protein
MGRKKTYDKENIIVNFNENYVINNGVELYQTQLDQLHSLLNTFVAISNTMNEYNFLKQQDQEILAQQQLFPIFNEEKSFLLARPQTPKSKRSSNRQKKNSGALCT